MANLPHSLGSDEKRRGGGRDPAFANPPFYFLSNQALPGRPPHCWCGRFNLLCFVGVKKFVSPIAVAAGTSLSGLAIAFLRLISGGRHLAQTETGRNECRCSPTRQASRSRKR